MSPIIFSVYVAKCPFAYLFIFFNSRRFSEAENGSGLKTSNCTFCAEGQAHRLMAFGLYCDITETNCIRSGLNFEWKLRSIAKKPNLNCMNEWMTAATKKWWMTLWPLIKSSPSREIYANQKLHTMHLHGGTMSVRAIRWKKHELVLTNWWHIFSFNSF